MRNWPIIMLLACLPALLCAHVGSPNVFFEGQAGPYPVRVIIRPPAVLPGAAQVDVRVEGASSVSLQAALWGAGPQASAAPVTATAVAGETNLFNAVVWFFYNGSYSVQVRVEGERGSGTAVVPITSAALRQPSMSAGLAAVLIALGIVLFAWAVWLVGASARASLPQLPARFVTVLAAGIFAGAIYAGKNRWQRMDCEFRNNALAKPVPVLASTHTNGNLHLLRLTPSADVTGASSWDTLAADHGKLMHLFLLRAPDFNAFAHLHPVRRDARTFENVLPPLPAGDYQLYAEITHENGLNQTLIARVALPEPAGRAPQMALTSNMLDVICQSPLLGATNGAQPFALDADDSWHTSMSATSPTAARGKTSRLMGGLNMVFQNAEGLVENRETSLRFQVLAADGQPATLQHYMGMLGHAVVRREGGEVFTHLHPIGTISMAAQELFTRREGLPTTNSLRTKAPTAMSEVSFPYAFPRAGDYRLWAQVRIKGRVLTGVFDVQVKPAR